MALRGVVFLLVRGGAGPADVHRRRELVAALDRAQVLLGPPLLAVCLLLLGRGRWLCSLLGRRTLRLLRGRAAFIGVVVAVFLGRLGLGLGGDLLQQALVQE